MTEIPIVVSDDVVTVGGYTNQVELQLSVGATGQRGSRIFTGSVDPTSLPTDSPIWGGYTDFKSGDIYLQRDTDLLAVWEWLYALGEYTWVRTVDNIAGGGGSVTLDPDIEAIGALTGTGYLRRTAPNTWALDSVTYQAADADLTAISALGGTAGFLKKTATDTWALDTTAAVVYEELLSTSATLYTVTHNLGTMSVDVTVKEEDSPYETVFTTVNVINGNQITVRFASAPAANKYRAIIMARG